jgi:hypothetical protein
VPLFPSEIFDLFSLLFYPTPSILLSWNATSQESCSSHTSELWNIKVVCRCGSNPVAASMAQKFVRHALGFALALYAPVIVFWQHRRLTSEHVDRATLLSTTKDAFYGQSSSGSNHYNSINPIIPHVAGITVLSHRPASLILQNPKLPDWVKQYSAWHKEQRKRYLEAKRNNSSSADVVRFLISRCLEHDQCGGASDRLQDMPYNLMLANQTNRVLLIRWEKPARLEHYLVPHKDGIDWTLQGEMYEMIKTEKWHLKGEEGNAKMKIVSTIRRFSPPLFRKYENDEVGHKM